MEATYIYKTLDRPSNESLYKEKGRKFIVYAFPVKTEDDIKTHLEALRKEHHSARHWCYAYQVGIEKPSHRANDDGEPNNSAGQPIYGQILSFELTNVLVVVGRYFGGTKLGVGGLIHAYKTAAQQTLESGPIIIRSIDKSFRLTFDYKNMNKVMRIIKEHKLKIIDQQMELKCQLDFSVRKGQANRIFELFDQLFEVSIKEL